MPDNKSIVYDKAKIFAIQIVEVGRNLINTNREYVISKQVLRSGTSIGANIAEANGAISKAEFSAKISIAYKESLETKFWLTLLHDTNYISQEDYATLFGAVDELARILFSIIRKTRMSN